MSSSTPRGVPQLAPGYVTVRELHPGDRIADAGIEVRVAKLERTSVDGRPHMKMTVDLRDEDRDPPYLHVVDETFALDELVERTFDFRLYQAIASKAEGPSLA